MCTFSLIQNEANSHVTVSALSFCSILITRMAGILLQREHSVSLVRETPRLCRARLPWWHACIVEDLFCLSLSQCESAGHSVKQQSWMSHCAQDTVGLPNSIRADGTDSPTECRLLTFQLSKINEESRMPIVHYLLKKRNKKQKNREKNNKAIIYPNDQNPMRASPVYTVCHALARKGLAPADFWQALAWMISMSAV